MLRLGLVEFNSTFFLTIFNILVLFFVLKIKFFDKIMKVLNDRSASIEKSYKDADVAVEEAQKMKKEYEEKLADIKAQELEILSLARTKAQERDSAMLKDTEAEISQMKLKARADIDEEKNLAMSSLKDDIIEIAVMMSKKILEKEIDVKQHHAIIDEFIEKVEDEKWQN